jgi:hypothetical protein
VGGTETDADLDGFSPACGPTPWDDDTDAKIYPGALQFCDGKDNTLLGAETGDVDTDGDGYFDCFTGTPAPNSADCNKTLCCVGPEATEMCGNQRDDNCNELTDESPCEFEPDCQ